MTGEEAEPFLGDTYLCFSLFDPTKLSLLYHVQEKIYTVLFSSALPNEKGGSLDGQEEKVK